MTIIEKAAELGAMIKDTPEMKRLDAATKAYEEDDELKSMIEKYNELAHMIAEEREKGEHDESSFKVTEEMLDNMYELIIKRPTMTEYMEAKHMADHLMQDVYGEITFQITGQRPCDHNCDGCHGCDGGED